MGMSTKCLRSTLAGTCVLSGCDMMSKAPRLEPNFHWPLIDAFASPATPLALIEHLSFQTIGKAGSHFSGNSKFMMHYTC